MAAPIHTRGVYLTGPNITNLLPTDRVNFKIGLSDNNAGARDQRLGEHQRHCPGDIEHCFFPTNLGDAGVRKHLCSTFAKKFGANRGRGREVISLLVSDYNFLVQQITLYFNAANHGNRKLLSFLLRSEQDECLAITIAFMSKDENLTREFLWDCKMRFGKTHAAYQLIMRMDFGLVLILTGRPTDTKQSWIDAMDHVDFDFGKDNFIDASKVSDPIVVDPNKRTIIFASLQDLARLTKEGLLKPKFKNFPNMVFDLLIKDECHLAFDTPNTKEALAKLNCKHILNLSGTPFRALLEERFEPDAMFSWSYLNEQYVRAEELARLGQANAEKDGQYYWLCPMTLHTILLSPELYEDADVFTEDEGFTFTKLFSIEEKVKGVPSFINEKSVKSFLDMMSHELEMPYSKHSRYSEINLRHALWYLPRNVKAVELTAAMLKKHRVYKHYDIIIAAGANGDEGPDTVQLVKSRIADVESGRNKKHIGTITLSCGKLGHGVSIPEWGSVFILSDMTSAQLYFQLIFRGQTPWVGMKHECYVFDFNPNRTLEHLYTLAQATANGANPKPILNEMLKVFNVLCYEGTEFKAMNADELIAKLEEGFGRSTSLVGLQSLFEDLLPINLDDLVEGLDDIELNGSKIKGIEVNKSDVKNGKNSRRLDDSGNSDDSDDEDDSADGNTDGNTDSNGGDKDPAKDKEELSLEAKKERAKIALRAVPLYFLMTGDVDFDSLVSGLDDQDNSHACRTITGLPARSLKKILSGTNTEKRKAITQGIMRFRSLEEQDHMEYQRKISQ
jgi:hypothetical protein